MVAALLHSSLDKIRVLVQLVQSIGSTSLSLLCCSVVVACRSWFTKDNLSVSKLPFEMTYRYRYSVYFRMNLDVLRLIVARPKRPRQRMNLFFYLHTQRQHTQSYISSKQKQNRASLSHQEV